MRSALLHLIPRHWRLAAAVYVVVTLAMLALAAPELLSEHTPHNHFSLLAESWIQGDLALRAEPPAYAGMNDFARYQGRWFVVFPPAPALLLLPFVWIAGSAEGVADGLFWLCIAGIGPAALFLTLEKLRREYGTGSERRSLAFSMLFAFGTPYFFSAVQGTVWYAAHVVGVALLGIYCHAALRAQRPLVAGVALGLAWLTRAPILLAALLFVFEAWRVARVVADESSNSGASPQWGRVHWSMLLRSVGVFLVPLLFAGAFSLAYNVARFDDPFEPGYQYLAVRWQSRIQTWGLFNYHYLARNLGVLLTSLPWVGGDQTVPFRINGHGLALWFTTPAFLWIGARSEQPMLSKAIGLAALAVALPTLFYQNTGWVQFAYRFANDYALLLILVLALRRSERWRLFGLAACWSVAINLFGAVSFGKAAWSEYYHIESTQRVLYQPD